MSFYAYEDEEKQNEVWAENVTEDNKLDEYFCPACDCTARLFIRSITGDRLANFAAKRNAPHIPSCRINLNSYNPTEYDEDQFNLENFINNLLRPEVENNGQGGGEHGEGDGRKKPISTVRQLYAMCVNKSINQFYRDIRISDLLVDSRTRHIYYLYIRGFRLVECYCQRFVKNENEQIFFAKYWLNDDKTNSLELQLKFNDMKLFNKCYDKIFQKNIVVAGNWERENYRTVVRITRSRQIYTIKNQV